MNTKTLFLITCALAGPSAGVHAASPAEDAVRQFVERVQTLSARFEQVQKDGEGAELQRSTGQLWLARPGRFRWAYERPYEQLLVCDGETIWMYDPDLSQVTVRPARETLAGTPAELLASREALERQFAVADGGLRDGLRVVVLKPKRTDSDFKAIEMQFRDGMPVLLQFEDSLGGTTEVRFRDVQANGKPDAALFTFKVPKGVEVIEATEPQAR